MLWVDLAIALLAILFLVLTAVRLWRVVRVLGRSLSDASAAVGDASAGVTAAQDRRSPADA